jgi:hypothetical protein
VIGPSCVGTGLERVDIGDVLGSTGSALVAQVCLATQEVNGVAAKNTVDAIGSRASHSTPLMVPHQMDLHRRHAHLEHS